MTLSIFCTVNGLHYDTWFTPTDFATHLTFCSWAAFKKWNVWLMAVLALHKQNLLDT